MADQESAGRSCPHCGSPVGDTDKFCITCGKRLDEPADAEPASEPAGEPEAAAAMGLAAGAAAGDADASAEPESEPTPVESEPTPVEGLTPSVEPVTDASDGYAADEPEPYAADETPEPATDEAQEPAEGETPATHGDEGSDLDAEADAGETSDEAPASDADAEAEGEAEPDATPAMTSVLYPTSGEDSDSDLGTGADAALTTRLDGARTAAETSEGASDTSEAGAESSGETGESGEVSDADSQKPGEPDSEEAQAAKARRRRRGIIIGIVIGCVAVAVAGLIALWYFVARPQTPVPVPITVSADGYSTDCTSIPVEISTVNEGRRIETETVFVRGGTSKISLPPGTYSLNFPASPLTPSGILYETPKTPLTVTVAPGNGFDMSITGNDQEAVFTLSTALDETDEMIQNAYDWAIKDPTQADRAVELRDMAVMVHENAVAEKEEEDRQAEEERQRQEEEERRRQEEEARQQEEQQRQQQAEQDLQNALNSIQGTWTSNVQGGVEDLVVSNDQATFYLHMDDGTEDSAGPYTVAVASTSTTSQYEFNVTGVTDTGEQTVARLTYMPSSPSTLTGYIIGNGGDTIVTYTKA